MFFFGVLSIPIPSLPYSFEPIVYKYPEYESKAEWLKPQEILKIFMLNEQILGIIQTLFKRRIFYVCIFSSSDSELAHLVIYIELLATL